MRTAIVAIIIFILVTGCSSQANTNPPACTQALAKADKLLQLAEQSLQISARQILAVGEHDATQMVEYNNQLHDISRQADEVGPEYRQLKEACTGVKG